MTVEAQRRITLIAAIAETLLVTVIIPFGIYMIKSTIELKAEINEIKFNQVSREVLIQKGNDIRAEAIEIREELSRLRADMERRKPRE